MADLVVVEFLSLDGVMQAPGNAQEDPEQFPHGGWSGPYMGSHRRYMPEVMNAAGAFLLGRKTYEIFAGYWPQVTDPADEIAAALNSLPKYVVSQELTYPQWNGTTVLKDGLASAVARVKQESARDVFLIGSSRLARGLIEQDLVDQYRLWLHPVLLGSGKRLFPHGNAPLTMTLSDSRTTADGVVILTLNRRRTEPAPS